MTDPRPPADPPRAASLGDPSFARTAWVTALVYGSVAALYILVSGSLLAAWVDDARLLARLEMAKGWAFVAVTTLLLYVALRRRLRHLQQEVEVREELERRLRQGQKMEAVGRLAGGIAHDFNNLLTVIRGHGEILQQHAALGDPARESVMSIQDAADRAAALTRQLLAFGRQQVMVPRVVLLNDVVAGTEKLLRRAIGEDILLTSRLSPEAVAVEVDAGQIEQVLLNLALNARDAMSEGGRLTLETRAVELDEEYCRLHPEARPGRYGLLAVHDSGCGMPPEVRGRLFEPFFTTKVLGHGLGLATAFGIVQQSGGRIEVESEVGRGSTFTVLLPQVESRTREAPKKEAGSTLS